MTTKKTRDFLDKELFVNRSIVTFRSLSRELGIHVNDAKSELQHYYDAVRDTDTPAIPTYLLSGEVPALTVKSHPETQHSDFAMDLDLVAGEDREVACQSKVLLVDASALDEARSQFIGIYSVHIYSLSSARFGDAGLVCTPSRKIYKADAKGGPEFFSVVGKITGPHVKYRSGATYNNATSSSKGKELVKQKTKEDKKLKLEPAPSVSKQLELKLTPKSLVPKPKSNGVANGNLPKHGIKRKPGADTEDISASEKTSTKAKPCTAGHSSLKKRVISPSEDDDSESDVRRLGQRRPQRKSTVTSDSETSLRTMMDIDDEQVDRVPRVSKIRPQPQREEEEESSEPEKETTAPPATSEGEESDNAPVLPKKRKPRKVIPVGRNGLRKRRVVKSRTTTDAKGYIQMDDYSSYESVEEEAEAEAETKPKGKGKGKETKKNSESAVDETKPKMEVKEDVGKSKAKPTPKLKGGAAKRGGLFSFFGPEKGKK